MRTLLLSLAGAVSALAVATPSSAAAAAQPVPYGYGTPGYGYGAPGYGYGYGYNNYGTTQLQARVAGLRQQVRMLGEQRLLSRKQAKRLSREVRQIDEHLRRQTFAPMNPYELQQLQARIARVEQRVQYAMSRSRYGYQGYASPYGYGQYGTPNTYYGRGDRDDDDRDYDDGDYDD
jgi:hypothetical protein